jgi:hypothetical protein
LQGELVASDNIFFGIGFLATKDVKLEIPFKAPAAGKKFPFTSSQAVRYQRIGIF